MLHVNMAQSWNFRGKMSTVFKSGLLDLAPRIDPRTGGSRVVHFFGNTAPLFPDRRTVVTVHDLMSLNREGFKAAAFRKALLPGLARLQPTRVVVISSQTADDLGALLPRFQHKVQVIPHGVRTDIPSIPEREHLLMFGGSSDPRKRTALGLAAYASYASREAEALPLIIAGRAGVEGLDLAQPFGSGRVIVEPNPDNKELLTLLQAAACVIYPSKEEGFGLPIVEAAEVGTRVLCERDARIPIEVLGEHVLQVAGVAAVDWAAAIKRAIQEGPVSSNNLSLPSWSDVAAQYRELYQDVATNA